MISEFTSAWARMRAMWTAGVSKDKEGIPEVQSMMVRVVVMVVGEV